MSFHTECGDQGSRDKRTAWTSQPELFLSETRLWRHSTYFCWMSVTRELRRRLSPDRSLPPFEPCLPRPAKQPPAGPGWIHEIKHDGFRILARWDARDVRLFTRNGYAFADRFAMIVAAVENLPVRSCFIDGEAIVVDANGLSVFELIRYRQHDRATVLCAFDLVELDGEDLRRSPFEYRKRALAELLRRRTDGIVLNVHYEGDGVAIYKAACTLGCEGIVSKRLGSPYRAGRSDHWVKVKNPAAPAVKREAEEDWGAPRKRLR
jgi:bifunctional non-homologous end joining protein LigD